MEFFQRDSFIHINYYGLFSTLLIKEIFSSSQTSCYNFLFHPLMLLHGIFLCYRFQEYTNKSQLRVFHFPGIYSLNLATQRGESTLALWTRCFHCEKKLFKI
jgi:hypothetical protein